MIHKNLTSSKLTYFLAWSLILLSLFFNVIVIGLLWRILYNIKDTNEKVLHNNFHYTQHMHSLNNYVSRLSTDANQMIDTGLDNLSLIPFDLNGVNQIDLMISHFHGVEINENLYKIKKDIFTVKSLWKNFEDWRLQFNQVNDDIKHKKTLAVTKLVINQMRNETMLLEGQNNLRKAQLFKKYSNTSEMLKDKLPPFLEIQEQNNLNEIRNELDQINITIESFAWIRDEISLIVLRDNQLKQSFDTLKRLIQFLEESDNKSQYLNNETFEKLISSILGEGYSEDINKQSLIEGQGGLYALFKNQLQLIEERKIYSSNLTAIINQFNTNLKQIQKIIDQQEINLEKNQVDKFEVDLRNLTSMIILFCLIVFLIARNIIIFIKKQISITDQALKKEISQKEKAELIMHVVPSAIFTTDTNNTVTSWNEKCAEITGFSKEEILGKSCLIFEDPLLENTKNSNDQNMTMPLYRKICTIKTKNGQVLTISRNADYIKDYNGNIIGNIETFEDITEKSKAEEEIKKTNERLVRSERALKNIMADMKSTNMELKNAQTKLVQSEKLSSLGQLSAGIAHEINNPLGFITNNIDILEEYVESYSKILRAIQGIKLSVEKQDWAKTEEQIKELNDLEEQVDLDFINADIDNLIRQSKGGAERIRKIVQDLRTFARKDEGQMELNNVEEIIDGVINIVWNEIKYTSELKKEYAGIPLIRCNSQKLGQVFINLIINASHAIKEKGEITIKTFMNEDFACIQVKDTGEGIPDDVKSKIFDPFFTTKDVGKGTGLGLSIAYDIIKQHNGIFEVESEVKKGTTFTIKLPVKTD